MEVTIQNKSAKSQDNFLDFISLVLTTTWYTFNHKFYQIADDVAIRGLEPLARTEVDMEAHKPTAVSTAVHSGNVWELFVDCVYSNLNHRHLKNVFHQINNLH